MTTSWKLIGLQFFLAISNSNWKWYNNSKGLKDSEG
jgi:hypothetical protein